MNRDQLHGIWMQCSGRLKERWGTLTGDPRAQAAGARERRVGRAREQQGLSRQEYDLQIDDFMRRNRNWRDPSAR